MDSLSAQQAADSGSFAQRARSNRCIGWLRAFHRPPPEAERRRGGTEGHAAGDALRRFKVQEFSNFMLAITAGSMGFPQPPLPLPSW